MREHKLYWWGCTDHPQNVGQRNNFGDILSPLLFDYFDIPWSEAKTHQESNIISIGSVARLAKDNDIVVGSGIIRSKEKLNNKAIWKSVRGPLTREQVLLWGGQCPDIYGDPALMLPLICAESEKQYEVGIVPHYQHWHQVQRYSNIKIIDVRNPNPLKVAQEITKCKKIISSSLHGIICAHAYGIPAAWIDYGGLHGDRSKFYDHYQSLGLQARVSTVESPLYSAPDKIDLNNLIEVFESLKDVRV